MTATVQIEWKKLLNAIIEKIYLKYFSPPEKLIVSVAISSSTFLLCRHFGHRKINLRIIPTKKKRRKIVTDKFRKISMDQYFGSQSASQRDAKKYIYTLIYLGASFLFRIASLYIFFKKKKNIFIFAHSQFDPQSIESSREEKKNKINDATLHRWQQIRTSFAIQFLFSLVVVFVLRCLRCVTLTTNE